MKILIVMIRDLASLDATPAQRGLCDAVTSQPELAQNYTVMIWDDSPEAIVNSKLTIPFLYRRTKANLDVSGTYNGAMEYALDNGYSWMLLLDQDTQAEADFLRSTVRHGLELEIQDKIAVIALTVFVHEIIKSPRKLLMSHAFAYLSGQLGVAPGEASVIRSGCLMRVAAPREIAFRGKDLAQIHSPRLGYGE